MKKFKKRIGDLEVRSCNEYLGQNGKHTTAEIVQWSVCDSFCWTVAYWIDTELRFVGSRTFDCNRNVFWKLAKYGQKKLD